MSNTSKSATVNSEFSSETIKLLAGRVSVRKFADRPVEDAMIEAVLRAAFRAPTSSNIQAYSVVQVRALGRRFDVGVHLGQRGRALLALRASV